MPHLTTDDLRTVAEQSEYTRTSSSDEVDAFVADLASRSSHVRVLEFGRSHEGRPIPLVTIANPPVESAEDAQRSGKLRFFVFANIHAGEVCGKEAVLEIARELALDQDHPLLESMVVLLVPNYNPDGNDHFAPVARNRPGQDGPEEVGTRRNAQDLDLNRDYVKLEAPETRAMARFLTEWDPHITMDLHTTNGSRHRYTLTYAEPLNPSGASEPIEYVRDTILPRVTERVRESTGYEMFSYGNFNRDHTVWATYSAHPRFGSQYHGLRGQMSILSEAYSYAPFKDRIICTREFVREVMQFAADHDTTVKEIHNRARNDVTMRGTNPQPDDVVGVRHELAAYPQPVEVKGFEYESELDRGVRPRPTDTPKDYRVTFLGRFEPTLSVARPVAYIIPAGNDDVVDRLRQHGVVIEPFRGSVNARVYTVTTIERSRRPFEGHTIQSIEVTAEYRSTSVEDGAVIVRTAQPLGNLIVYLLEPQSEDGFAAWDLFGDRVAAGSTYPVWRVEHDRDLDRQ